MELYGNLGLAICQRMVHGTVILLRLSSSSRTAWNESSLKPSERTLAASRIWRSLTGAAKSVVRHLSPADFDSAHGLQKLLEALPGWNDGHLEKDYSREHTQLLVREEEKFTEFQQSLSRARQERVAMKSTMTGPSASSPPMSPSRSPGLGVGMSHVDESQENANKQMKSDVRIAKDFFGDELRGHRLLKAARLSTQERQSILTTGNSTRFEETRRALRTLFADETNEESIKRKNIWWVDPELDQWNYRRTMWTNGGLLMRAVTMMVTGMLVVMPTLNHGKVMVGR